MSPSCPSDLRRRRGRSREGQSTVELALALPVMLVTLLGLVEFGNALDVSHALTAFSREAANNAARGTPLDTVVAVVEAQGSSIGLATNGGAIASRIDVEGGLPVVREQVASAGWNGRSRIADADSVAYGLVPLGLLDGHSYWAVELFYEYDPLSPVDGVLGVVWPGTLYRRSLF